MKQRDASYGTGRFVQPGKGPTSSFQPVGALSSATARTLVRARAGEKFLAASPVERDLTDVRNGPEISTSLSRGQAAPAPLHQPPAHVIPAVHRPPFRREEGKF
ncbi:MAG TPA: hypothetical protein VLK65_00750 [Vicinamibacteria bacterium]|nr:hypothetical protein [Vicinamibacteria bacterium]